MVRVSVIERLFLAVSFDCRWMKRTMAVVHLSSEFCEDAVMLEEKVPLGMDLPLTSAPLWVAPANAACMVFIWLVVVWRRLLSVVPDPLSVVSKCPPMSLPSCLIRQGPGAPGNRTLRRSSLPMSLCANAHVFPFSPPPNIEDVLVGEKKGKRDVGGCMGSSSVDHEIVG